MNVKIGVRIVQIMFLKRDKVSFAELSELGETARGTGGFASTNLIFF